jgi:formyltetrahydrofolate deformylase
MRNTAVLLLDCPDRKGLIARVSGLLYEHGAHILHADQHQDHDMGLFFMRVEWMLGPVGGHSDAGSARPSAGGENGAEGTFDLARFRAAFSCLAAELNMRWQLAASGERPRVALFCSRYLHCVTDLLQRWRMGELDCEIPVIISNQGAAESLASFYGISFAYVPVTAASKAEVEAEQIALLERYRVDLVVLARYMQVLSPAFVARYPAAIINVHHSFLPAFTGARPYQAAHARGVKLIGATSHYVTEVLDDGPIIEQDVARISHRDQVDDLVARGRDLERMVLSRAVRWHLDRRILCYGNKTVVFD